MYAKYLNHSILIQVSDDRDNYKQISGHFYLLLFDFIKFLNKIKKATCKYLYCF